jgi:two-component system chemotaxis response regulator CheB
MSNASCEHYIWRVERSGYPRPERARGEPAPVVALVASAGGLNALSTVLAGLSVNLAAAVVVVQHLTPTGPSALSDILASRCALTVRTACDGDHLEPGTVFVTPPGRHMLLTAHDTIALIETDELPPPRPSGDLLLASLAVTAAARGVAVVLTGSGHDGQAGVRAVHRCGGRVIAQDERSSQHFGMPGAAIATGVVDRIAALDDIAEVIGAMIEPYAPLPRNDGDDRLGTRRSR